MTALPHPFVWFGCAVDGMRCCDVAADHLSPKWFTNNADSSYRANVLFVKRTFGEDT